MKTVLVYQDYIHNNGVLFRRLRDTFGADRVRHCDAADIIGGCLDPETVGLFVMPGGADLYYCEKLNGAGNTAIRSYVEAGGTYLGICAGAYYACRRIEWARDQKDAAIIQDRELEFFAGTAIGPLPEYIENFEGSWAGVAALSTPEGLAAAFYRGGCGFIPDIDSAHVTLASYDLPDRPAALIETRVGRGRVILSGCHIEHTPAAMTAELYHHNNSSYPHTKRVLDELTARWHPQMDLWGRHIEGIAL